jgi:hypothetical protein
MNEDAEKLKITMQEFLKTLPKEKLDKFRQDAEIINYFVKSEQHLKREPLSDEEINAINLPEKQCTLRELVRLIEKMHGIGEIK